MFSWSEPVNAPADLEIADEQWEATEEKLKFLVSDRLPRAQDTPGQAPPAIEPLYQPENGQPIGEYSLVCGLVMGKHIVSITFHSTVPYQHATVCMCSE